MKIHINIPKMEMQRFTTCTNRQITQKECYAQTLSLQMFAYNKCCNLLMTLMGLPCIVLHEEKNEGLDKGKLK